MNQDDMAFSRHVKTCPACKTAEKDDDGAYFEDDLCQVGAKLYETALYYGECTK